MIVFKRIIYDFVNDAFIYKCVMVRDYSNTWKVGGEQTTGRDHGKWLVLKNHKYSIPNAYEMFAIRKELKI